MQTTQILRRLILLLTLFIGGFAPHRAAGLDLIISGGEGAGDMLSADDILEIYLNGVDLHVDSNIAASSIPPVPISAENGATLHVIGIDYYGGCRSVSPIYLHRAGCPGYTKLSDGVNGGCQGYPPGLTPFFDQTFTVNVSKLSCDGISFTKTSDYKGEGLKPGDKLKYTLEAGSNDKAKSITIIDHVPTGTVLVPGSVTGGGKRDGTEITWKAKGTKHKTVHFQVQVRDAEQLPPKLKEIKNEAKARVVIKSKTTAKTAKLNVPLLLPCQVKGRINDVTMDFPNRTFVSESKPLHRAVVRLLKSDVLVVGESETDEDGHYSVSTDEPGSYTLEVRAKADSYTPPADHVTPFGADVIQRRTVEFDSCEGKPLKLDLAVPRGIISTAAGLLKDLNHLDATIPGTILDLVRAIGFPFEFKFNTTAAELAVNNALNTHPDFEQVYRGSGTRDAWNSVIRLNVAMTLLRIRFREEVVLADDLAKNAAVLITVEAIKRLMPKIGKALKDKFPNSKFAAPQTVQTFMVDRFKVGVMAFGVGQALPVALDALGVKGEWKARSIEVIAKAVRFGFDFIVKQAFIGDAIFEVIFNTIRVGILSVLINGHIDTNQPRLDSAGQLAFSKTYSTDTNETLAWIERYNGRATDRFDQAHDAAISALKVVSIIRGLDGVWAKTKLVWRAESSSNWAKFLQDGLDTLLKPVVTAATATGYTTGFTAVFVAMELNDKHAEAMINAAFSGPVGEIESIPALNFVTEARTRGRARVKRVAAAKVPEVAEFLALLRTTKQLVKQGDVDGYYNLREEFAAKGNAAFGYLSDVDALLKGALPEVSKKIGNKVISYVVDRGLAENLAGILVLQIEAWAQDPTNGATRSTLKLIDKVSDQLAEVTKDAQKVSNGIGNVTAPGYAAITEVNAPTDPINGGDSVQLKFRITNAGEQTLPASTVMFHAAKDDVTEDPRLDVLTANPLNVPALAPGGSVVKSWTVQVPNVGEDLVINYQVVDTRPDGVASTVEGIVAVAP